MCHSGTSTSALPSSSAGSGAPVAGPVACGAAHSSAILLIDELGLPMAGATAQVTIGGAVSSMTADGSGTLCFTVPPGTSVQVQLGDTQETQPGESTTTASGHHFLANGTGP